MTWSAARAKCAMRDKLHMFDHRKSYGGRTNVDSQTGADELARLIESGKPFLAGRLGKFETAAMHMFEFERKSGYQKIMDQLYDCAGFFPNDISLGKRFLQVSLEAFENCDIYACNQVFPEEYFIKNYLPKDSMIVRSIRIFENHRFERPWSAALKGKKVLVVTSFPDTVKRQYINRELLFPDTDILPEFDLQVYKPLMTIGNMRDDRFNDWFEALEFMKKEVLELDFDVALVACGAYGLPLASAIKNSGRGAIQMGGVLQLLFGIIGKRWDGSRFGGKEQMDPYLKRYYSDAWTYPLEKKPAEAMKVEYGPYWK